LRFRCWPARLRGGQLLLHLTTPPRGCAGPAALMPRDHHSWRGRRRAGVRVRRRAADRVPAHEAHLAHRGAAPARRHAARGRASRRAGRGADRGRRVGPGHRRRALRRDGGARRAVAGMRRRHGPARPHRAGRPRILGEWLRPARRRAAGAGDSGARGGAAPGGGAHETCRGLRSLLALSGGLSAGGGHGTRPRRGSDPRDRHPQHRRPPGRHGGRRGRGAAAGDGASGRPPVPPQACPDRGADGGVAGGPRRALRGGG
jgi:hypothetical protein